VVEVGLGGVRAGRCLGGGEAETVGCVGGVWE